MVGKIEIRMENSFSSLILDIVVVEVDGRIVFMIEVRSWMVFKNANVGLQMWLCLMARVLC